MNTPLTSTLVPIPFGEAIPHRKVLRQWMLPLVERTTVRALLLLILDYALLGGALTATVLLSAWWAKLLMGMVAGFITGRLFIIGHDGCHQSLTPHRGLNRWLGRIAFLPSLTPFSLWDIGHNVVHHGFTNLKGLDFVWAPLTATEYAALSPRRQWLERLYRSGVGPGFYYLIEIWWNRMYFPNATHMSTRRAIFWKDGLLVSGYALLWAGGLIAAAIATGQSVALILLMGFAVPFFFWCSMIGFVVYVHHTHAKIAWYDDKATWTKAHPFVTTTVHLTFRYHIGTLLHHIMEHTAHHLDMTVPLYKLKNAQTLLETMLPGRIVVQPFSWRWYFQTARACKLYDFKQRCWTDFAGKPTSESVPHYG
jgi:acyl-lipid omega-6 desaturase (Delta-12 desaturase)